MQSSGATGNCSTVSRVVGAKLDKQDAPHDKVGGGVLSSLTSTARSRVDLSLVQ